MDIALDAYVVSSYELSVVDDRQKSVVVWLNHLMKERAWGIVEVMEKTGLSRSAISKHLHGKEFPKPPSRRLYSIAFGFPNLDAFDAGWRSQRVEQYRPEEGAPGGIPILSECPAGNGDTDPTNVGLDNGLGVGYIARSLLPMVTDPLAYALIVRGDSMDKVLQDGQFVICSPHAPRESGRVYAIRFASQLDDQCTIKRVIDIEGDDELILEPMSTNPAHKPRKVLRENIVRMDRVVATIGALGI